MKTELRIVILTGALVACGLTDPNGLCACDPVTAAAAVIYGEVTDPDGHPVENSRVSAHIVSDAPCPSPPAALQPGVFNTTGAAGQFRYALGWASPATKCFALWAAPAGGSGLTASDTTLVVVNYTPNLSDSSLVRLQLR